MSSKKKNSQQQRKPRLPVQEIVLRKDHSLAPDAFLAQSVRTIRLRFLGANLLNLANVLFTELAAMCGCIATSTTASVLWAQFFRLRRVRAWSPVATAGTPVTIKLVWISDSGIFESPNVQVSDTSVSFDHPAHIDTRPPRGSVQDKWHRGDDTELAFTLSCPVGTVLDLDFEYVMNDNLNAFAGPAISGGALGRMFHKVYHGMTSTLNST